MFLFSAGKSTRIILFEAPSYKNHGLIYLPFLQTDFPTTQQFNIPIFNETDLQPYRAPLCGRDPDVLRHQKEISRRKNGAE